MDEQLAQQFHEAYERLAPQFSYETRKASAKPWAEVPDNNKQLMRAVMSEVMLPLLATEYDRGKVEAVKAYIEENCGPRCETKDTEDFPEFKDGNGRCITCEQWENYDEWLKSKGEVK